MKRLGMLLVLVSVGMFTLVGCGDTKKTTPKKDETKPAAGAADKAAEPAPPAAPEAPKEAAK